MRVMRLYAPADVARSPLRPETVDRPRPGLGEVLVRVSACGVCRTDLHIVEGELIAPAYPVIPGHQVVGVVEEAGDDVTSFVTGQRVGVAWLHETCEACAQCTRGYENLCPHARFTGFDVPGGYAEYVVVGASFAYEVPGELNDVQAAPLLCAGIIGYRALRLSGVQPGQRLGMYGFGAAAHITIQVAVHRGIDVYAFSRSSSHQSLARRLGAKWCGSVERPPADKLHGSVVFAPAGWIVPLAMEHLDAGGTCALAGIYMTEIPPMDYTRHLYRERRLCSVTASTRADGVAFLKEAASVPVRTQVTTYRLEEANEALAALKRGTLDGAAVLSVNDSALP